MTTAIDALRIVTIRFHNYKAFQSYGVTLHPFNVLVGPNNAGKSTVIGALRILSEGIRKARARSPEVVSGIKGLQRGYAVDLRGLAVSTENVFHNYDDSEPATVTFRLSNGNELILVFPEKSVCNLVCESVRPVRSPSDFRREFDLKLAFVPVLGPVEHNERLYKAEAARLALLSHSASRNFRNIWYHFSDGFHEFREMVRATWPGMDIEAPELIQGEDGQILCMFCPEERFPREIFWAGFGFQVWCQMLTFIVQAKDASLLVIDEPDIYLHSDLQRQLVGILRELGPAVILATHSTEIIAEVESETILNVNKRFRNAKRVHSSHELNNIFAVLGSNLNPTLTQLAKTRRAVFVEGKDFQLLSRFARKLGLKAVANRADFAVVPVGGFNPQKVKDFAAGMELTLGAKLLKAVIFDRDYRTQGEAADIEKDLRRFCNFALVHDRKELENYTLHPSAIARAVQDRVKERDPTTVVDDDTIKTILLEQSELLKNKVLSRTLGAAQVYEKRATPSLHPTSISEKVMDELDAKWSNFAERMKVVPGKDLLSLLNSQLQQRFLVSLTAGQIIDSFKRSELPPEIATMLTALEKFRRESADDDNQDLL